MSVGIKTQSKWRGFANLGRNLFFRDATLSPAVGTSIWETAPQLASLDPAVAIHYFDDFLSLPIDDTTGNPSAWKWVSDTATGAITLPKVTGGVVNVACGGTDNNETYIQLGGSGLDTPAPFVVTDSGSKPLWASFRVKAVETADQGVFVGLAEEGSAAANFLADNTGIPADKDFIGFRIKADASDEWDVAWKKAGQTEQEVANVVTNAGGWHLFEFVFDGASTVYFYVDRSLVSTQAVTSAATFPSGQNLAPIIAVKTGEAVAKSVQVDYIKILQVR